MPEQFASLYAKKPRARVMIQRPRLLELGGSAASFVAELSRCRRDRLGAEICAAYGLNEFLPGVLRDHVSGHVASQVR